MEKTADWFSKRDNIKLVIVIALSLVLILVLKTRMSGGKDASKTAVSPAMYKTAADTAVPFEKQTRASKVLKNDSRMQVNSADTLKAPPFLKRDLFSYRNSGTNPKRNTEQMEEVSLVLTATIIDDQGAIAIIGNEVLRIGEMIQGMLVSAINNNEVILVKGESQYVLRINEE